MSTPQILYLVLVGLYLLFFLLFLRLFVWKRYSEIRHWRPRPRLSRALVAALAAARGGELPFISIFVPARDEADVIHRTLQHLARLDYPAHRFEIVVATDQKEELQRARACERAVGEALHALRSPGGARGELTAGARRALFGLLAHVATTPRSFPSPGMQREELTRRVAELAERLWHRPRGIPAQGRVARLMARRAAAGHAGGGPAAAGDATELALALAVMAAYERLTGGSAAAGGRWLRAARHAGRARHPLTRALLSAMSAALAERLLRRVRRMRRDQTLEAVLEAGFQAAFPTTQEVVERTAATLRRRAGAPAIRHVQVPFDFDGALGGRCIGREVGSTKGRALNWALPFADPRAEVAGFYDAESRPDRRVLLYVAWRRLQAGASAAILQGPVFQVRNFYQMSAACKVAALYQTVSHDWYLPLLFRRIPFTGGTNLFVDLNLLRRVGGFDPCCLTEDLEFGARAYLEAGVWPEYLPFPSSEQTPPTVPGFFRQRLRWGAGYLQVIDKLRGEQSYPRERVAPLLRRLIWKGHVEWAFAQVAMLLPLVGLLLWWQGLVDPSVLPASLRYLLNSLVLVYVGFTFYAFFRYARHVDASGGPPTAWGRALSLSQLLLLPAVAFVLPVPYSSALVLHALHRGPTTWVKTPRTRE